MTVEILRFQEYYVVALILKNGLVVLAAPIFETDGRNVKRTIECLCDVFLHAWEQE